MAKADDLDLLCVNTIRTLAMDAVERAQSGHPGAPMGMAPVAYVLFDRFLRHDPSNPMLPNRDRFVLSMGHASMLLYSILHLTGYDIGLDDLKRFRQLHGKCAGHPEFGLAPGVETTTGPLGQGAGNSVGMAMGGKWLAEYFNRPGHTMFDYRVFAMCSDGDMMEGVASEAASLAGHLALDNLIWIYDSNGITIDGATSLAYSEDVGKRFGAYGWEVMRVGDANDLDGVSGALEAAIDVPNRPSLIIVNSQIGYGSPGKQDSAAAHGAPLGAAEIRATKLALGWDPDAVFHVPREVLAHLSGNAKQRGDMLRDEWHSREDALRTDRPEVAAQWRHIQLHGLPDGWDADLPTFAPDAKGMATRKSGGQILSSIAEHVPWLIGGSADLAASNNTMVGDKSTFASDARGGRNMCFGIREHAMAAAANGLALTGLRPYVATFLVFSDYMRPSIRLAALMGQPVIYVFTHDSVGVGEDGPTHQPIEHLAALRAIPRLLVIRPGDGNEVAAAWRLAMSTTDRPVALILTRQNVPTLAGTAESSSEGVARGAYVLADCEGTPDVALIGTGSELQHCVTAQSRLTQSGIAARVVSMPCREAFWAQDESYRSSVLPPDVTGRVSIEAGITLGWERVVGPAGVALGIEDFGASAPGDEVMLEYGMTADAVVEAAQRVLLPASR